MAVAHIPPYNQQQKLPGSSGWNGRLDVILSCGHGFAKAAARRCAFSHIRIRFSPAMVRLDWSPRTQENLFTYIRSIAHIGSNHSSKETTTYWYPNLVRSPIVLHSFPIIMYIFRDSIQGANPKVRVPVHDMHLTAHPKVTCVHWQCNSCCGPGTHRTPMCVRP